MLFINSVTILTLIPTVSFSPIFIDKRSSPNFGVTSEERFPHPAPQLSAPGTAYAVVLPSASPNNPPDHTSTPWVYPIMTSDHSTTTQYAQIFQGFEAPARRWLPGHRGVDFLIKGRTKIVAPVAGTVTFSGKVFNRRSITITSNNGFKNSFEPVQSILRRNDTVKAGDTIGYFAQEDKDHSHCFPKECIHWGVRDNSDEYQNPLFFLHDTTQSVLLPHLSD